VPAVDAVVVVLLLVIEVEVGPASTRASAAAEAAAAARNGLRARMPNEQIPSDAAAEEGYATASADGRPQQMTI
jgi:hypothetical protein